MQQSNKEREAGAEKRSREGNRCAQMEKKAGSEADRDIERYQETEAGSKRAQDKGRRKQRQEAKAIET